MKTAIIKLTSAFLSAALLTGCGSDLIVKVDNAEYRNYFSDSRTVSIDLSSDISSADISLGTGGITVVHTDEAEASVYLDYTVRSNDKELCKEVADHIDALSEEKNGRLIISIAEKKTRDDIEKWTHDKGYKCQVELSAEVRLPKTIDTVTAETNVGSLNFRDIKGCFSGEVSTGSITCVNTEFTDSSSMKCGTGHVTMRDCTYMADTSVSAETGQLLFGLPTNGSAADIDLSVDTGNMEICDAKSYEITDGSAKDGEVALEYKDTKVSASVKTGNISIDKE